ncbi:hypothetical protein FVEN_g12666 [Fusarium venenatum]|nr:hypothetical protein FVEN_g12666 [Fusarium venenatum]
MNGRPSIFTSQTISGSLSGAKEPHLANRLSSF